MVNGERTHGWIWMAGRPTSQATPTAHPPRHPHPRINMLDIYGPHTHIPLRTHRAVTLGSRFRSQSHRTGHTAQHLVLRCRVSQWIHTSTRLALHQIHSAARSVGVITRRTHIVARGTSTHRLSSRRRGAEMWLCRLEGSACAPHAMAMRCAAPGA